MGKKTKEIEKSLARVQEYLSYVDNNTNRLLRQVKLVNDKLGVIVARGEASAPPVVTPGIGTFTDARDGQVYRTVKMPDGKVWMAENLNYKPETGKAWAYDNDETNREKYGLLYEWEMAQKVAPSGWHLPTRKEWNALVEACGGNEVAGKKLKSITGWNNGGRGADDYGFSALPGGYSYYSDDSFGGAGRYGYWWTATENDGSYAYTRYLYYDYDGVVENYDYKSNGFSVRCLRDE